MDIKSNKGISMVELIVTVAIIGIITAPIVLVFITSYTNFISESDKAKAEQCAREVLYGKGITSYGVIGDLERSNAKGSEIVINNDATSSSSITIQIKDDTTKAIIGRKVYSFDGTVLKYEDTLSGISGNFFMETLIDGTQEVEKSPNGKEVKVKDFKVEKKQKGSDINSIKTDADIIEVSVTVETGKSGLIKLESSYRINVED